MKNLQSMTSLSPQPEIQAYDVKNVFGGLAAVESAMEKINQKFEKCILDKQVKRALPKYIIARQKQGFMTQISAGQHDLHVKISDDYEIQPVNSSKDIAVPFTCKYRVRPTFIVPKIAFEERKKVVQMRSRRGSSVSDSTPRKSQDAKFISGLKKMIAKKCEEVQVPLKFDKPPPSENEIEVDKKVEKIRQIHRQRELEAYEEKKQRGSLQKLAKQLRESQVTEKEKQTKRPSDSLHGITTDFQGVPMLSVFPKNVENFKSKAVVVPKFLFTESTDQLLQQNMFKKREAQQKSPDQSNDFTLPIETKKVKDEFLKHISRESKLKALLEQDKRYEKERSEVECVTQKTNNLMQPTAGVIFKSGSGTKLGGDFCTTKRLIFRNLSSTSNHFVHSHRKSSIAIPQLHLTDLPSYEQPKARRMINIDNAVSGDRLTSANTSRLPSYDKIEVADLVSLNEMIIDFDQQLESGFLSTQARSFASFSQNGEYQKLMKAKKNLALARQKNLHTSARPLSRQMSNQSTAYSQSRTSILRQSQQQRQRMQSGKIIK